MSPVFNSMSFPCLVFSFSIARDALKQRNFACRLDREQRIRGQIPAHQRLVLVLPTLCGRRVTGAAGPGSQQRRALAGSCRDNLRR